MDEVGAGGRGEGDSFSRPAVQFLFVFMVSELEVGEPVARLEVTTARAM